MEANRIAHVYVGIFAVLGLITLFFIAIRTNADESISDGRPVVVDFPHVRGLLPGANVSYQGVRIGLVEKIELVTDDEGALLARVRMSVMRSVSLYNDAEFSVNARTLLGTMEIGVSGGTPESGVLEQGVVLRGKSAVNIEEAITKLSEGIDSVKGLADNLNENQGDVFSRVKKILDENEAKINEATTAFAEAGPQFQDIMANVKEVSDKLAAGEGTLGKMVGSSELYDKVDKISTDVDLITAQIAKGEGTMGKLIFSEEGLEELKVSLADISEAFDEIKSVLDENRGEIAEAVQALSEVGPTVQTAADDIKAISQRIESGEGTLGKLVNDPALYDEAKGAASQLRETLEEAEEQTILQSFFRIFTGGI